MKFRNKKTGEVFNHHSFLFCRENDGNCPNCPIFSKLPKISGHVSTKCNKWIVDHPKEAAELMGYELVEETMKPRICEVLGVEVGQIFKIKGAQMGFYVDSDGIVKREEDDACTGLPELCFMINLPERMEKNPIWTDQEVQDAKAILRMFGADNFTHVTKDPDGWPSIMDGDGKDPNTGWCMIGMEKDMFPSLKPGQTTALSDIIGGAE